jgi:hypothetical protein
LRPSPVFFPETVQVEKRLATHPCILGIKYLCAFFRWSGWPSREGRAIGCLRVSVSCPEKFRSGWASACLLFFFSAKASTNVVWVIKERIGAPKFIERLVQFEKLVALVGRPFPDNVEK